MTANKDIRAWRRGEPTMRRPYTAVPASPAEQQDPKLNPSGGYLGWVVVDAGEAMVSFGDGYMSQAVAQRRAVALNQGRPGTDVPNIDRED